ncbi:hypothetical protein WP50_38425, partial [Lactiplantibacillus plantarum]
TVTHPRPSKTISLITPPTGDAVADFPPLVRHEFKVTEISDIVFEGLGWVTVAADTRVAAWAMWVN